MVFKLKQYHQFLLSHFMVALAAIVIFKIVFLKPWSVIPLHLLLIVLLYTVIFSLSYLFDKWFKLVSVVLFSTLTCLLALLYIIDGLANSFWNDNVSLDFIFTYFNELPSLLNGIPYALEFIIGAVFLLYGSLLIYYFKYVYYLDKRDKSLSVYDLRMYFIVSILAVIYFYYSFIVLSPSSNWDSGQNVWYGEPIASLALRSSRLEYLSSDDVINFDSVSSRVNPKLKNIVLIHADAMRADHMSSYGYYRDTTPYISSLLDNGAIQFDMGLSLCSESICGMLSALGSRYVEDMDENTPLIHSYLKKEGYFTAFIGTGDFSWENLDAVLSHDIDFFMRADQSSYFSINNDEIIPSTLSNIPEYSGVPTFFFLRFLSAHTIGLHYPEYKRYQPEEKNIITFLFPSLGDEQTLVNAYDNHVLQMDDYIKKSLLELDLKGYLDNSIVVIYGDHGDALNEHGYYGHYQNLYQEEIKVPIIFWSKGESLSLPNDFATLDDILPTILSLTGLEKAVDINGLSLVEKHSSRNTYHNSRVGIYGVVQYRSGKILKLIFDDKTKEILLFDLISDPKELNNLANVKMDKKVELLSLLQQHFLQMK